ncbi:MAG TPA: ferrous iron transport protein B [Clostridia bacterium]|nr:ferrous iron transport protein B [Clostridia bacterium]
MGTNEQRTLGGLQIGRSGHVKAVNTADRRMRRHITDMGITPGTEVRLIKAAPMGDPLEIGLRGYTMSLRRADAETIQLMSDAEHEEWHERTLRARADFEKRAAERLAQTQPQESDRAGHIRAAELTAFILEKGGCCENDESDYCPREVFGDDGGPVRLALVGNPNCGKTTLFNAMTGAKEYVGNWPGVTVEKKEGKVKSFSGRRGEGTLCTLGHEMTVVDLPGIYSLSPYSMEEIVARDYIINEKPEAIINIVDGTNLERNLYLTIQLLELERPIIIALNMMDEVEKRGDTIDCERLSLELGIPVVPISARTGEGIEELVDGLQRLIHAAHAQFHEGFHIEPDDVYDDFTHMQHHLIGQLVDEYADRAGLPRHWTQIKLLEGDERVRAALGLPDEVASQADGIVRSFASANPFGDNESMVADSRYAYIEKVTAAAMHKGKRDVIAESNARIDRLLTNKWLALPLFLLIMGLIFTLTFSSVGAALSDAVGTAIDDGFAPFVRSALESAGAQVWFVSLVCDGIIKGVGGVLTFLPQIALLFLCLSLLEDSGYMSRIAFIMDKPMRRLGLSGKSFIPLLMGFGCTVPAAMGARTMDNQRDRRMTILLLPFMSCSAKLPVYGLIASAFFEKYRALVIFSLYLLGILMGILSGLLFRGRLFEKGEAPFVIELPPYRWPTAKNTFTHVWERVSHFLEKAGTIIFAMSVVIWFLQSFDFRFAFVSAPGESILGKVGTLIAPIFMPLGFGSWQASVALLTGLVAKEAVVSSLSMFAGFAASAGGEVVRGALSGIFTPAAAYSFLVFVLVYTPCMAAVAMMRRELESIKWTVFAIFYQMTSAWLAAFAVYHSIGLFTGETSMTFIYYLIAAAIVIYSGFMLARHFRRRGCCDEGRHACEGCRYAAGCSQKGRQKGTDK